MSARMGGLSKFCQDVRALMRSIMIRIAPFGLAWLFVYIAQVAVAQDMPRLKDACLAAGCLGIQFHTQAPLQGPGLVSFDIEAVDPIGQAYVNQVIDLVAHNLQGWADVNPEIPGLDAFGNLKGDTGLSVAAPSLDALELSLDTSNRLKVQDQINAQNRPAEILNAAAETPSLLEPILSEPTFTWQVSGLVEQDQQELTELTLSLGSSDSVDGQSQPLTVRANITDWDRVAHYLSDLIFENFDIQHGLFQSQVLFIARRTTAAGADQRLALMDQSGHGLRWIGKAGAAVGFATFLETRFDIAYLDQSDGRNSLIHYNVLTDRTTPLVQLPDLIGRPDLGTSGRFIAFASKEDGAGSPSSSTDMIVVDVEAAVVQTLSRAGTDEKDPNFSPDLSALAMISQGQSAAQVMVVQFQDPLGQRDRTKGGSPLENWNPEITTIYETTGELHHPSWSPDGRSLAFIERQAQEDTLMIFDFDNQDVKRILSGPGLANPVWSPHPDFLALVARSEPKPKFESDSDSTVEFDSAGTAYLLRVDLGRNQIHVLQTPFEPDAPAWSPRQP